jgi:hypothetical protein
MAMSQRRILNLAVIGVPPQEWSGRYAPALLRLEGRVRIAQVFDPLVIRAQTTAGELSARAAGGIRAALAAPQVSAVLLLDGGWQSSWMLHAAAAAGHPCFIGQQLLRSMPSWLPLQSLDQSESAEAGMVPECLLRYQPALLRLRELLATRLGPARQIHFWLDRARRQTGSELQLREVINWFTTGFEVGAAGVGIDRVSEVAGTRTATLSAATRTGHRLELQIALPREAAGGPAADPEPASEPFCHIRCAEGSVELMGGRQLTWESGGQSTSEQLAEDRSATAVALDLFARRAVGGLIPVPALTDLVRAQRLMDEIESAAGGPVPAQPRT